MRTYLEALASTSTEKSRRQKYFRQKFRSSPSPRSNKGADQRYR